MTPNRLLFHAAPALGLGFLFAFGSAVGQTYFLSLFAGELRSEFGLSHGAFGGVYTIATMASAVVLVWLGKLADRYDPVQLGVLTFVVLAACALLLAEIESVLWLGVALFGLRLGGQGMLSHLAMTAMGRWFADVRGRALGVATLGFPAGEALLPPLMAVSLSLLTWRELWNATALVLLLVFLPIVLWLGRTVKRRGLDQTSRASSAPHSAPVRSWTRAQMLRDARFYGLLPGLLAPAFIMTGVLFHQVHLVDVKGWTLAGFAASYPLYAGSATAASLGVGWLIDRYGAIQILPFYLLPLALSLALLGISDSLWAAAVFMTLMGATAGAATIVLGALLPELYGTAHLGAIRALSIALLVFATAISPGVIGWLIDQGLSLNLQFRVMSVYTVACAVSFALLLPSLRTYRAPPAFASRPFSMARQR